MRGQVASHEIDVVGQVLPDADDAAHLRLTTQPALGPDFAGNPGDLGGEGVELIDHDVDRVLQLQDFALDIDRDLLGQVAAGNSGRDLGDIAHLGREVARHRVDVVGEVFPGARCTRDMGLAAQAALGADLACHARDFRGKGIELVDHYVDGVLELEDLALDLDGDLLGEVAPLHRGGYFGDVSDLGRKVGRELVDLECQVLPRSGCAGDARLAAQAALGADFAGHAGDLAGESVELIHHRVDGVFQLENLAADIDRDLLRQVAFGDGGRDLGDIPHLGGEVAGHVVNVVGEIFPDTRNALHLCLATQLALR